jgi:hypothetical protein
VDDGFYCDDCADWHESIWDCPQTLYDCPDCDGEGTVKVDFGPAPEDVSEAHCDSCGWTQEGW